MIEENELPGGEISNEEANKMTSLYDGGNIAINSSNLRKARFGKDKLVKFLLGTESDEVDVCLGAHETDGKPTIIFKHVASSEGLTEGAEESGSQAFNLGSLCPPFQCD